MNNVEKGERAKRIKVVRASVVKSRSKVKKKGQAGSVVVCMMPDNGRTCNECGERVTLEKG